MKYTAILAAAALLAPVSASNNWQMQADPCSKLDKKACLDDSACRFTLKPRSETAGKKESKTYGRHFGPAEKGGHCAAIHVYDRANGMTKSSGAHMLKHHGLHHSWDQIPCTEAFFLKDCKDISQHGTNTCSWSCEGGCEAADELGSKYRPCLPPVDAEAAAPQGCEAGFIETKQSPNCGLSNIVQFTEHLIVDGTTCNEFDSDHYATASWAGSGVLIQGYSDDSCSELPDINDIDQNRWYNSDVSGDCADADGELTNFIDQSMSGGGFGTMTKCIAELPLSKK